MTKYNFFFEEAKMKYITNSISSNFWIN